MSWPIEILKSEGNIANGHIEKFQFTEGCRNQHKYNHQVVTCEDGYSGIWRHIADDWFKQIGKWPEGPWTCQ